MQNCRVRNDPAFLCKSTSSRTASAGLSESNEHSRGQSRPYPRRVKATTSLCGTPPLKASASVDRAAAAKRAEKYGGEISAVYFL